MFYGKNHQKNLYSFFKRFFMKLDFTKGNKSAINTLFLFSRRSKIFEESERTTVVQSSQISKFKMNLNFLFGNFTKILMPPYPLFTRTY